MTPGSWPKDLAVLIADKNIEGALRGLLSRPQSLGLRQISCDLFVHPERDPGCLLKGHHLLKPFTHRYEHALVVFDREGCGREEEERTNLELQVEDRLSSSGWDDRATAVVIDPELEIWVWADSPHVESALGWSGDVTLREWLVQQGWLREGESKPAQPKMAVDKTLRQVHTPRSSSIYQELARRVSTVRCVDPAFLKLRQTLASWFSR
jgi:hypothetical protein